MKQILFFIIVILSWSGWAQSGCTTFHEGNFYTVNGTDTCFLERKDDRQFEFCQSNSEEKTQYIVIWMKDCKYILRSIEYNPSTKPVVMRNDVVMTILETYDDRYFVSAKKKGQQKVYATVYRKK